MSTVHRIMAAIGAIAGFLVLGTLIVRSWESADQTSETSSAARPASRSPDPDVPIHKLGAVRDPQSTTLPAESSDAIDLLNLIDGSRDQYVGRWGFDGSALYTAVVQWGRLQIPYSVPQEYDVHLVVTRESGNNSLNLGLSTGKSQFMIVLDGGDGLTSGIDLVDDRGFTQNDTTFGGKVFRLNRKTTISCSVRTAGVTLSVDGRKVIDWKGEVSRIKLLPQWHVPNGGAIFLGCWETLFRIDEFVLVPRSLKSVPSRGSKDE